MRTASVSHIIHVCCTSMYLISLTMKNTVNTWHVHSFNYNTAWWIQGTGIRNEHTSLVTWSSFCDWYLLFRTYPDWLFLRYERAPTDTVSWERIPKCFDLFALGNLTLAFLILLRSQIKNRSVCVAVAFRMREKRDKNLQSHLLKCTGKLHRNIKYV